MQSRVHDVAAAASGNYAAALEVNKELIDGRVFVFKKKRPLKYGDSVFIIEKGEVKELKAYECKNGIISCVRDNGVRTTVKFLDAYTEYKTAKDAVEREQGNEPSYRQNT